MYFTHLHVHTEYSLLDILFILQELSFVNAFSRDNRGIGEWKRFYSDGKFPVQNPAELWYNELTLKAGVISWRNFCGGGRYSGG